MISGRERWQNYIAALLNTELKPDQRYHSLWVRSCHKEYTLQARNIYHRLSETCGNEPNECIIAFDQKHLK